MAQTVYLLGAGINRSVKGTFLREVAIDQHELIELVPPLATDFFQQVSQASLVINGQLGADYGEEFRGLFEYIERYWKLSFEDLKHKPFDLESCFTLIQQQKLEAERGRDAEEYGPLNSIEYQLTALLRNFLLSFDNDYGELRVLGERILKERAAVLTFNYDTLLESTIESNLGLTEDVPESFEDREKRHAIWDGEAPVPDDYVGYSNHTWSRLLAYGVAFDEVEIDLPGPGVIVPGERFYAHPANRLYDPPFLKLHGSLNWFAFTKFREWRPDTEEPRTPEEARLMASGATVVDEEREGDTVMVRSPADSRFDRFSRSSDGWFLEPLIITPVLHKELSNKLIRRVWERAREELETCKRLVVGGYSFPPTDFATRRLFLEAFSDNALEELVVINPDTSVVGLVKDLCHFTKPVVVCKNLEEYLAA